jgi:hypothetical protein
MEESQQDFEPARESEGGTQGTAARDSRFKKAEKALSRCSALTVCNLKPDL